VQKLWNFGQENECEISVVEDVVYFKIIFQRMSGVNGREENETTRSGYPPRTMALAFPEY
jgi:hypothetical protein